MDDYDNTVAQGIEEGFFLPYNPMTADDLGSMHYAKPRPIFEDNPDVNQQIANDAGSLAIDYIKSNPVFFANKLRVASAIDYIKYRTCGRPSPYISHIEHIYDDYTTTSHYQAAWLTSADMQHFDQCIELAMSAASR